MEPDAEKRVSTKKRLSYIFLGLILLVTGISYLSSPSCPVGSIKVVGNTGLSAAEVIEIAGVPDIVNVIRLNTSEMEERLGLDLRISDMKVYRAFPATIVIEVSERLPIAYLACDYGFLKVDREGIVLAAYKTLTSIDAPLITGFVMPSYYVGDKVEEKNVAVVLKYLSYLSASSIAKLSEIDAKNLDQISAYTTSSVQIKVGKAERLEEKAALTDEFLQELSKTSLPIDYIDLNYTSPFIKFKQR
jgi:cell division protein FtsQ